MFVRRFMSLVNRGSMWPLRLIILILALSLGIYGQSGKQIEPQSKSPCKDESSYDKFKDVTTVVCGIIKDPSGLNVNVIAEYQGTKLTQPTRLSFFLNYFLAREVSRPIYSDANIFYVLTDSSRMELEVSNYKVSSSIIHLEDADVKLDEKATANLLKAKTAEARWGNTELHFSSEQIEQLQDFIRRYQK